MRVALTAAALLLLAGLAALGYASSLGQLHVGIVFVFPVAWGTGPWAFLGGVLLAAGLLALFGGLAAGQGERALHRAPDAQRGPPPALEPPPRARGRSATGGFILVGPIPIAFGSTRALAVAMLVLALVALLLAVVAPFLLLGGAP